MSYQDLILANFEVVQSKYYSLSELEEMVPFEWEVHLNLLVGREEQKREAAKNASGG